MGIASHGDASDDGSRMLEAIVAADPSTPDELRRFHRLATESERPDFYEHSVRFGETLEPHRLTYYFDVQGVPERAQRVAERFGSLAAALGRPLAPELARAAQAATAEEDPILQVVLGIERSAAEPVCKLYLVLRGPAAPAVRALVGALGLTLPARLDPAQVYIVGVDWGRDLVDAKLYYRLDVARLGRVVQNLSEVGGLGQRSRVVVLQECLARPGRRRLYLHAGDPSTIASWLGALGAEVPSAAAALERQAAINAQLRGTRIDPWILALRYEDGVVATRAGTVYFHVRRA